MGGFVCTVDIWFYLFNLCNTLINRNQYEEEPAATPSSAPSKMSSTYIWCFIGGGETAFKVKIPIDSDIDDLKNTIKQRRSRLLDKFDAADLILWKVCYFW
jgi:hypothetical protein